MAKIRYTKNELKQQRDALKRFNRYLPMLQLKKQQLQVEAGRVESSIEKVNRQIDDLKQGVDVWVDVFAEDIGLESLIKVKRINTETGNIAGIDVPIFNAVDFQEGEYDYFIVPLWADRAIDVIKEMVNLKSQLLILDKQKKLIEDELRITAQRVNLFEKVKIPEAVENIRLIQIQLGDLQTASVVRGKIAKEKIEKRRELISV